MRKLGMEIATCLKCPAGRRSFFYPVYLRPVPVQQFILYLIAVIFKRKKKVGVRRKQLSF